MSLKDRSSSFLIRFNPAVSARWQIAIAGLTWAGVGVLLCRYSFNWLSAIPFGRSIVFGIVGVAIAIVVHKFGMSRIAEKNLNRLRMKNGKTCIFGFLSWKSYANIAVMVTMGVTLRHSAVPKDYLSLVYTSMGGGLLLGSIQYYKSFFF